MQQLTINFRIWFSDIIYWELQPLSHLGIKLRFLTQELCAAMITNTLEKKNPSYCHPTLALMSRYDTEISQVGLNIKYTEQKIRKKLIPT